MYMLNILVPREDTQNEAVVEHIAVASPPGQHGIPHQPLFPLLVLPILVLSIYTDSVNTPAGVDWRIRIAGKAIAASIRLRAI